MDGLTDEVGLVVALAAGDVEVGAGPSVTVTLSMTRVTSRESVVAHDVVTVPSSLPREKLWAMRR